MEIAYCSYLTVSSKGEAGGLRQLIAQRKNSMEDLGCKISLFSSWDYDIYDCDIFHIFSASLATYQLGRVAKEKGKKLVVSPRFDKAISPMVVRYSNAAVGMLPKVNTHLLAGKKLLQIADVIVVWSDVARDFINQAFGIEESRIEVVPYGVDPCENNFDPDLFRNQYYGGKFILSVGNLGGDRKNFLRLIKAVSHFEVPVYIIGPIPNNNYSRKCVNIANKYKNIHLLGFVDKTLLMSAFAAADVYVQPSITEGVGIAILNAALAGSKLVVTENGAPSYYLGDHAIYVNPRSIKSIRLNLLNSLEMPKSRYLRDHLIERFSWENSGKRLLEIYENI
jgi:glycosyltransferase involved in cell wall biosynthesis